MDIMPYWRRKVGLLVHIDFADIGFAVQILGQLVDNGGRPFCRGRTTAPRNLSEPVCLNREQSF